MKTAFLGLGVMGYPMAGHLANAGHEVTVYNRSFDKAEKWLEEYKGLASPTPGDASKGAEIVFMCVGQDKDIEEVVLGEHGALSAMEKGSILVDHTTASAGIAEKLYGECRDKGVGFLDAPVSGGQAGAEKGALTVMVGGDQEIFDRAKPAMELYGKAVTLMGPAGSGQKTKMVNQICIAGLVQALSEGVSFAENSGLDVKKVLDVISKGAAQSWQMENRGETMADRKFDYGFALDWMIKDLGICLEEGRRNGSVLPVTSTVQQFYLDLSRRGKGRWDTSSLVELLRKD
ncbi:NAD(P)-dependent oxidoreductase [Limisalsivibrio acetivorans]|uniref:NAD(P)-dependent oxidoreductase n=1 Tax=Limisalsivibrio acetivorans TaxID=1304888 RepID=UPI0003B76EF7|nr:NAD(P)-dependent oxidoreductase [Limisalsivibrio acetivorans]